MSGSADQRIETAIAAINGFLDCSERDLLDGDGEHIQKLAARIHEAQAARKRSDHALSDAHLEALHTRYREALERLRIRLDEIQRILLEERDRSLQQQASLARTRAWHRSLSTTQ